MEGRNWTCGFDEKVFLKLIEVNVVASIDTAGHCTCWCMLVHLLAAKGACYVVDGKMGDAAQETHLVATSLKPSCTIVVMHHCRTKNVRHVLT
jgi:hypothetical protein